MTEQALDQPNEKHLQMLNEFGKRFMDLKAYFLRLNLPGDNVRLAVERLDDGFLRAREAIFALPMVTTPLEDDKVPSEPVVPTEPPLVA